MSWISVESVPRLRTKSSINFSGTPLVPRSARCSRNALAIEGRSGWVKTNELSSPGGHLMHSKGSHDGRIDRTDRLFPAHDQSCKCTADPEFAGVQKWENIPVSIGFRWCGYDAVARYPLGSHLYCDSLRFFPYSGMYWRIYFFSGP